MPTALERLEELERQVTAGQLASIKLEAQLTMLDHAVEILFAYGRPPTQQELTRLAAEIALVMKEKYPGLNLTISPAAPPPPTLFVPKGAIR